MPESQPGITAYLVCATQWNVGGIGGRTGLRYEGCIAVLERYLPHWQAEHPAAWCDITIVDLMQDIQIIESSLLAGWGEQSDAEAAKRNGNH